MYLICSFIISFRIVFHKRSSFLWYIVLQKLLMNVRIPEISHKHRILLRKRSPPFIPMKQHCTPKIHEDLRTVKFIPKQHSNHYNHYKSFVSMQHSIPMGVRVSRHHFWTAFRVHSYAAFYSENTEWELKETKQSRINSYVVSHSENLISIYSYFPICFSKSSWIG